MRNLKAIGNWVARFDATEPGFRGFKDYTPSFLKTYDKWVLGFMAPRVWKMGDEPALNLYGNHIGRRHLDVGPGTGYFIAESKVPEDIELTLVDPNPNVLDHCAETLVVRPSNGGLDAT